MKPVCGLAGPSVRRLFGVWGLFAALWVLSGILTASPALGQIASDPLLLPLPGSAAAPQARLGVLVREVDGLPDRETRKHMARALEDALCLYPNFAVYPWAAFLNQVGWERQHRTVECQFPDDCARILRERLGIRHEVSLTFAERADGRVNVRLRLIVGDEGRDFVEVSPDLETAPAIIAAMLPDLIGLPPALSRDQGVLHVSSFPLGAQVHVDGQEAGTTPVSLALPAGAQVQVTAQREGHPALGHTARIVKGELVRWHADLVTRQGSLLVDSNPIGATVLLDERPAGTTPLILHGVLAGEHRVALQMPPYPDAVYEITVLPDDMTRVRHGFSSEHGTLIVRAANPEIRKRVEIYLNDAKVAETTYTAHLPPGRYTIAVVAPGYLTHREEIELHAGRTLTHTPLLEKGFSLRPGEVTKDVPDYRPGGFSTAFGALLLGFGIYLELEAQSHASTANGLPVDDADRSTHQRISRDSRIAGGVLMGVGAAGLVGGVVLLVLPPSRQIAVIPQIEPEGAALSLVIHY